MKENLFKSFRIKMMLYTVFSVLIAIGLNVLFIFTYARIHLQDALPHRNYSRDYTGVGSISSDNIIAGIRGPKLFGYRIHWEILMILTIFSIILAVFVFLLLTRRRSAYLEEITKAIQNIAKGDYHSTLEVKYNDEFSIIAENLNIMALDLRLLKEKEQEIEATKNELITNVAHDLRTPLTSIIGYMGILNSHKDLSDSDRTKYINIVHNKSQNLEKMIVDLFNFTTINYGKMPIKEGFIDIVKLLEQEIEEFHINFEENHLVCVFKPYEPSTLVVGDGDLLARVFENLISNAIRYGKNGKVVKIYTKKEIDRIQIQIINYGSVIPKKDLPYVFDKFYRVEHSRQAETGGTGLGLSIAKSIVERHNGTIQVNSTMTETSFEISLKIADFNK